MTSTTTAIAAGGVFAAAKAPSAAPASAPASAPKAPAFAAPSAKAPTSFAARPAESAPAPSLATATRATARTSAATSAAIDGAKLAAASTPGKLVRTTYSADNRELPDGQLGRLVRKEGQGPVGDKAVDGAHDSAGIVHDFYKTVLGRDSIDGRGLELKSVVHYGNKFNNAFWDGEKMTYGDGDGTRFGNFSTAVDVVGHEMTHGVTERTSGLQYRGQSGALNESWSDVFGELIEQWHDDAGAFKTVDGAKKADWMIGEDIFTPGTPGDALRSMKAPGTGYKGDPQPDHMSKYKDMTSDNGGVHINSGIPNKAAYEVAMKLGGEKTAQIWYRAMTSYLKPNSKFTDAANATLSAARDLFKDGSEAQAVRDAWKAVGLDATFAKAVDNSGRGRGVGRTQHKDDGGIVPPWLVA